MNFLSISQGLLNGFVTSFLLFFLTLIFSLPLGLLVSFCTMSKFAPLRVFFKIIVWILRGTPLMLQIFVIFYVPGLITNGAFVWPSMQTGWAWFDSTFSTRFLAALVAFSINYAAYFSEIFRGGIESISKGQHEAGMVLGMKKSQIFFNVVLLQVVKRILPPISNETITLVKDTSLANTIGVVELMFKASEQLLNGFIWVIFYAGVFYLLFVGILTLLFGHIEKKLNYFKA